MARLTKAHQDIIDRAYSNWEICEAHDENTGQSDIISRQLKFCDKRNQWNDGVKALREGLKRACLVVDRTNPFVRQLVNQLRQNRSEPRVAPGDNNTDPERARIMQGLIRAIGAHSKADLAKDAMCESAVKCGVGYLRVSSEYESDYTLNQRLKIEPIQDPTKVRIDPTFMMPDGSDIKFAFISRNYTLKEAKRKWPKANIAKSSSRDLEILSDAMPKWIKGDVVTVVEYFEVTYERDTLYEIRPGEYVMGEAEVPAGIDPKTLRSRSVDKPIVSIYTLTATDVLESGTWAGAHIPIVPMFGNCLIADGKRIFTGVVWDLEDVATSYNTIWTAVVEAIASAPKTPYIGAAAGFATFEKYWKDANNSVYPYLPYNHVDNDGNPIPAPMPSNREAPISSLVAALNIIDGNFHQVSGMFDPTMGNRSESGQSGIAIARLQKAGEISQFHLQDNLSRSERLLCQIILEAVPKYYDAPQIIKILDENGEQSLETINGMLGSRYMITDGQYDLLPDDGPGFATQRDQDAALASQLMQTLPNIAAQVPHLLVKAIGGNSPLAKDITKALTPANADQEMSPQHMAQMQQMQQAIEMLQKRNQELEAGQQVEVAKAQMQADAKIKTAEISAAADIQVAQIDAEAKLRIEAMGNQASIQGKVVDGRSKMAVEGLKLAKSAMSVAEIEVEPSSGNGAGEAETSNSAGLEEPGEEQEND